MDLHIKASHYFISALAVVAALSWRDTLLAIFNKFAVLDNIITRTVYTLLVTVLIVFAIWILPDTIQELPDRVQRKIVEKKPIYQIKNLNKVKDGYVAR